MVAADSVKITQKPNGTCLQLWSITSKTDEMLGELLFNSIRSNFLVISNNIEKSSMICFETVDY